MNRDNLLNHFSEIEVSKVSDLIAKQIIDLRIKQVLKPGDRLPSENDLANKFHVTRGQVREALKRLEYFGVLQTIPQSGTVVANMSVQALRTLVSNMVSRQKMENEDFYSLLDTRATLEVHAAELAASNSNDSTIKTIEDAQKLFVESLSDGSLGIEEDINFHLTIAECSNNIFLESLILIIAPDIIKHYREAGKVSKERLEQTVEEHQKIVEAIRSQSPENAFRAMKEHMTALQSRAKNSAAK
jgi:GntR family transcriptional repressor for pyruvate dehydrogenase complex